MNTPRPLEEGFESEYAKQLIAVDTLLGGDIGQPEGGVHFIADSYPKDEVQLPAVYNDSKAIELRKVGGAQPGSWETVWNFIHKHGLLDARDRMVETLGNDVSPLRRKFIENMGTAFETMTYSALSIAEKRALPSFDERYRSAAKRDPELVDTRELLDSLEKELAAVGISTKGKELRDGVKEWEEKIGFVKPENFAAEVERISVELMRRTREQIFAGIDFGFEGYDPHLTDVPFDGMTVKTLNNVHYTGSSAYEGGLRPNGKPALRDLFEYNTDHPVTHVGLWHLVAHEMKPGHYIDSAIADLGWHSGKLGFEAVAHTMSTGEVALREGWAQNALAMLHGGSEQAVIDNLGDEHKIHYIMERLQDAGKQNGAILFQARGLSLKKLSAILQLSVCFLMLMLKNGSLGKSPNYWPNVRACLCDWL